MRQGRGRLGVTERPKALSSSNSCLQLVWLQFCCFRVITDSPTPPPPLDPILTFLKGHQFRPLKHHLQWLSVKLQPHSPPIPLQIVFSACVVESSRSENLLKPLKLLIKFTLSSCEDVWWSLCHVTLRKIQVLTCSGLDSKRENLPWGPRTEINLKAQSSYCAN